MAVGKQFDEENGYENSREIAFYMQQVAKDAGMTEEELAKQILAEEEPDDADGFVEETLKDQEALQSLGLWDRFKTAVKKPFTSMSDWSDSHDPQWKSAMVQAMFGDVAPMNNYYQQQKQIEEAQKNREFQAEQARLNRESQQEYNSMWKQIEKDKQDQEALAAAKPEYAKLVSDWYNANEQEKAVISERLAELEDKFPQLNPGEYRTKIADARSKDEDAANEAKAEEALRKREATHEMSALKVLASQAKNQNAKHRIAESVWDEAKYPKMTTEERQQLYNEIVGLKTSSEKSKEAAEAAAASIVGENVKKTAEEKEKQKKIAAEIDKGRNADVNFLLANGYTWEKHQQKWVKK